MKRKMRISKALEEVWEWKDRCYKEAKGMRLSGYLRKVHADVERLLNARLTEKDEKEK